MFENYIYLKQKTEQQIIAPNTESYILFKVVSQDTSAPYHSFRYDEDSGVFLFYKYDGPPKTYLINISGVLELGVRHYQQGDIVTWTGPTVLDHVNVGVRMAKWREEEKCCLLDDEIILGQGYNYSPDDQKAPEMGKINIYGKYMRVEKSFIPFRFTASITPGSNDISGSHTCIAEVYFKYSRDNVGSKKTCIAYISNVKMSIVSTIGKYIYPVPEIDISGIAGSYCNIKSIMDAKDGKRHLISKVKAYGMVKDSLNIIGLKKYLKSKVKAFGTIKASLGHEGEWVVGRGQFYGWFGGGSTKIIKDDEYVLKPDTIIIDRFGQYDSSSGRFRLAKLDKSMNPRILIKVSIVITLDSGYFFSPYDALALSIWDMQKVERITSILSYTKATHYTYKDVNQSPSFEATCVTTNVEQTFSFTKFLEVNPDSIIELSCTMLYPDFAYSRHAIATNQARVKRAHVSIADYSMESK